MAATQPLRGNSLINCARANASAPIEDASHRSGYGDDVDTFKRSLAEACQEIGISEFEFADLISTEQTSRRVNGIDIAPRSSSQL